MSGYVRLQRKLLGHPAFRNDAEAMAFAWMVLKAAWKETRVRYKGHDVTLQRGQLTISIRDFAEAQDRPKGWAERLFARLREHGMIEQKSGTQVGTKVGTHGGTIGGTPANVVTICNYNDYQADPVPGRTPPETPPETDARQPQDTEQVREEGKKEVTEANASVSARLEHLRQFWNENAAVTGWPQVRKLNEGRKSALGARMKEDGMEGVKAAIVRARASPYLGSDPPNWFTFSWFIKSENFLKLTEGNYDRRHNDQADPTTVALRAYFSGANAGTG